MTRSRYEGWPDAAIQVVERACERHGGWDRFERLSEVSVDVSELGGPLPALQGIGRSFLAPRRVLVEPHAERTTFIDWPTPDREGRYAGGSVSIVDPSGTVDPGSAHRNAMPRIGWAPLDALYFFGYAFTNYFALPFLIASTRFVGMRSSGVLVDFPAGFDTHSRRQAFYFDDSGLLVRHDYTADVVSRWAKGSHYTSDYADVDGLWFARRRRVVARLGSLPTPIPVLHARLERFSVTFRDRGGTARPQP